MSILDCLLWLFVEDGLGWLIVLSLLLVFVIVMGVLYPESGCCCCKG